MYEPLIADRGRDREVELDPPGGAVGLRLVLYSGTASLAEPVSGLQRRSA